MPSRLIWIMSRIVLDAQRFVLHNCFLILQLELVSKLEPASEDDVQSESLKREVTYRVALRKAS